MTCGCTRPRRPGRRGARVSRRAADLRQRRAGRARTLARGLIGLGIEPGDRVGILMANSHDAVAGLFGVALVGAVAVPVNTRYRTVELPFVVGDAQLRTIVTSDRIDDYVDLIKLLESALPGLRGAVRPEDLRLEAAPMLRSVILLGGARRTGVVPEDALLACAATTPARAHARRHAGSRASTRCCSTPLGRHRCRAAADSPTRRSCAIGARWPTCSICAQATAAGRHAALSPRRDRSADRPRPPPGGVPCTARPRAAERSRTRGSAMTSRPG